MTEPNRREQEIVDDKLERISLDAYEGRVEFVVEALEAMLASYRSELLKPFEEMLDDFERMEDERVAKQLREIIQTARGVP